MLSGSADYLGGGVVREEVSSGVVRYRYDGDRLEGDEDAGAASALFGERIERFAALAGGKGKLRAWGEIKGYEPGRMLEVAMSGRALHEDHDPTHAKLDRVFAFVYWAMRDASAVWGEGFGGLNPARVWGDDRKLARRAYSVEPGFGWVRDGESGAWRRASSEDDVRSLGEFAFAVASNRYDVVGTDKMLRVPFPRGHRVWTFLSDGDEELERLWRQRRCEELVSWVGGRATLGAIEDRMPARPKGLATPEPFSAPPVGGASLAQEPADEGARKVAPATDGGVSAAGDDGDRAGGIESAVGSGRAKESSGARVLGPGADAGAIERERVKPEKEARAPKPQTAPKPVRAPKPEKAPKPPKPAKAPKPEKAPKPAREPLPWGKIGVGLAGLIAVLALGFGGWQVFKPKAPSSADVQRLVLAAAWLGGVGDGAGDAGLAMLEQNGLLEEAGLVRAAQARRWEELVGMVGVADGVAIGDGVPGAWDSPEARGPVMRAAGRLEDARDSIEGLVEPWQRDASALGEFVRSQLGLEVLGGELDGVAGAVGVDGGDGRAVGIAIAGWAAAKDVIARGEALAAVWENAGGDELVAGLAADDPIRRAIRLEMGEGDASAAGLRTIIVLCEGVAAARASADRGALGEGDKAAVVSGLRDAGVADASRDALLGLAQGLSATVDSGELAARRAAYRQAVEERKSAAQASVEAWSEELPIADSMLAEVWTSGLDALDAEHGPSQDDGAFRAAADGLREKIERAREAAVGELSSGEQAARDLGVWANAQAMVRARRVGVIDGMLVSEGLLTAAEAPAALAKEDAEGFGAWLGEVDRVLFDLGLLRQGINALMLGGDAFAASIDPQARTFAEVAKGLVVSGEGTSDGNGVGSILAGLGSAAEDLAARGGRIAGLHDGGLAIGAVRGMLEGALGDGSAADLALVHAAWVALGAMDAFPSGERMVDDLRLNHDSLKALEAMSGDARLAGWRRTGETVWRRGWTRWSANRAVDLASWLAVGEQIPGLYVGEGAGAPAEALAQIEVNRLILDARGETAGARGRAETLQQALQGRIDAGAQVPEGVRQANSALRALLDRQTVEEGELEFDSLGAGWTATLAPDGESVEAVHDASGERLRFVRLREDGADLGGEGKAVFLCETEMSVGTVAAVLDRAALESLRSVWKELDTRANGGDGQAHLVVWSYARGRLAATASVIDDPTTTKWMRDTARVTGRDQSWGNYGASDRMPLQDVGFVAAGRLSEMVIGGRLPTVEEFRAALRIEGVQGALFDGAGEPTGEDWNLRDAGFDEQRAYAAGLPEQSVVGRRLYFDEQADWGLRGGFETRADATPWSNHDDGADLLEPVDLPSPGRTFRHLVGNVAEWVVEGDPDDENSGRLMGASAISPRELGYQDPVRARFFGNYGAFDVGFRVVIEADKQESRIASASDEEIARAIGAFPAWYGASE